MLFWLHPSLADAVEDVVNSDLACRAIERIVYSQIYGNHLYFSDFKTLDRLIRNGHFERRVKEHLKKVHNSFSQKGVYRTFKICTEICWGKNTREINEQDGKIIIRVSADVIIKSRITERAILLCENNRDIELYRKIATVFMWEKKLSHGFLISLDPISGGGNNISDQYNSLQKENQKFCLCILDTDWKYEGDNLGETASNLIHVHKYNTSHGYPKVFCDYKWILSREAENLIPTQALHEISSGNQNRQKFMSWFNQLEQRNRDTRFFVDIKSGLQFKTIIRKGNSNSTNYWSSQLKDWLSQCNFIKEQYCNGNCDCFDVPGMGDHTLDNVLKVLERLTPQKMDEMVRGNSSLMQRWLDTGEDIFYWFVSSSLGSVN